MLDDEIWNAEFVGDSTIRLFGRRGEYELGWPDVLFFRTGEVNRLPKVWQEQCEDEGRGFARCTWPEPVRKGGSRTGRLYHFNENVFQPCGVTPLEADVDPVRRFLAESDVKIAKDWRIFLYDLETKKVHNWERPWESRILSFSWKSLATGKSGHVRIREDTDRAERELLATFARLADRHDVLSAWHGSGFDDQVVAGRMALGGVPFDPLLYHWLDMLKIFKRYYLRSEDGGVTSSFALDAVAEAFLGERKIPVENLARDRGWTPDHELFHWVWKNAPDLLELYNNRDVDLMDKLEKRTGFLALHLAICALCRVFPSAKSLYPMTFVDGKMLRRGHETGYRFPTRLHDDEPHRKAKGAYVPDAQIGLHESVAVIDYARMYPSIIRTFNLSLETIADDGDLVVPETDLRGNKTGGVVARFRSAPEGHFPAVLTELFVLRKQYSDAQKKCVVGSPEFHDFGRLSNACKVLANTFYGILLSPFSRYYMVEVGESVTSVGRLLIQNTMQRVRAKGHRFVFGDTDSVAFVATDEQARAIKEEVNGEVVPKVLAEYGAKPGEIAIDYEKRYARILVTASKRYAGIYALYKGKPAPDDAPMDVRGLEIVRSDVCRAARNLQRSVIKALLAGEDVHALTERAVAARDLFFNGALELDQIVLSKGLTKNVDEYATKPHQVQVAERMIARGLSAAVGDKIPYLLTADGPVHPSDLGAREEIDKTTYWSKYVWPPTMRCLAAAFPDIAWDDFLVNGPTTSTKQLGFFGAQPRSFKPLGPPPPPREVRRRPMRRIAAASVSLPVTICLDGRLPKDAFTADVRRLRDVLGAFPGDHPVKVSVEYADAVVDLDVPMKIASPGNDPKLVEALRAVGARYMS